MDDKQAKKNGKRAQRLMRDTSTKHLEQLTRKARALAGEAEPVDMSLKAISQKLINLQQLHSKLQESLSSGAEQLLAARLRQEFEDAHAESTSVEEWEEEDCSDEIISLIRKEFLLHRDGEINMQDSLRKLFCLEGKMICGLKDGRIGIQYDIFYAGEMIESYYLVLVARSYTENLSICEHTIPFFLPIQEVGSEHLSSSPAMFINVIGDLLNAYVSRREQIKAFKSLKAENIKRIAHTVCCDVVDFMVEEFGCKVTVSLKYGDLRSERPTQTKAVIWPLVPLKGKQQSEIVGENKPRVTPVSMRFAEKILKDEHLPQVPMKGFRGIRNKFDWDYADEWAYKEILAGITTLFSRQVSTSDTTTVPV